MSASSSVEVHQRQGLAHMKWFGTCVHDLKDLRGGGDDQQLSHMADTESTTTEATTTTEQYTRRALSHVQSRMNLGALIEQHQSSLSMSVGEEGESSQQSENVLVVVAANNNDNKGVAMMSRGFFTTPARDLQALSGDFKLRVTPPSTSKSNEPLAELPADLRRIIKDSDVDKRLVREHFAVAMLALRIVMRRKRKHTQLLKDLSAPAIEANSAIVDVAQSKAKAKEIIKKGVSFTTIIEEKELKKIVKLKDELGKGSYGTVYGAKAVSSDWKYTANKELAVKCLEHGESRRQKRNYNEVFFLHQLKHPNILEFYRAYSISGSLWLLMELLEGGSLAEACKLSRFQEKEICRVILEVAKALEYMHANKYVHRDIKPDNVMISVNTRTKSSAIKLADFGLAADMSKGPEIGAVGTVYWMSPEMTLKRPHHVPTDIWSLGITLLELLNNDVPRHYSKFASLFLSAVGKPPEIEEPTRFSNQVSDVVSQMLQFQPEDRIKASKLVKHEWMQMAASQYEMWKLIKTVFKQSSINVVLAF